MYTKNNVVKGLRIFKERMPKKERKYHMKKIQTCTSSELLMLILAGGILSVMLAYRIFSWLCEVTAFLWWMIPVGLVMAVLAVDGFMVAYRAWRRLQYLRDHPYEDGGSHGEQP